MTIRTLVPGLAATAGLAVTATMLAASGTPTNAAPATDPADPTTLSFRLAERGLTTKYIDLGRRGESIGDRYLTGLSVKRNGRIAGRVLIECLSTDRLYGGQTCGLSVQLADGTLYLQGMGFHDRVPNVGKGDDSVFAVTGGSGAYAGARGEATSPVDENTVTVTLLP